MPPPFALDAAADASLASLGSLGEVRRHGAHHRNLSIIPELDESGEGSGGAVARTAAGTAPRGRPAVPPTHATAAAAALQPSPELAQPGQLRREQLRRPSPPSAGRSIATQAFYTAASEAPLPLTDENSCACTSDSPEARHAAAAAEAAAYKSTAAAAGVRSQAPAGQAAQHCTTLCGITRQAPGRRQSVGGRAGGVVGIGGLRTGQHAGQQEAGLLRSWACLVQLLKTHCSELHPHYCAAGHGRGLGARRWGVAPLEQAHQPAWHSGHGAPDSCCAGGASAQWGSRCRAQCGEHCSAGSMATSGRARWAAGALAWPQAGRRPAVGGCQRRTRRQGGRSCCAASQQGRQLGGGASPHSCACAAACAGACSGAPAFRPRHPAASSWPVHPAFFPQLGRLWLARQLRS